MKRTQKQEQEILKNVKCQLAVVSFYENGQRCSGYSGIGLIEAFQEFAKQGMLGNRAIVMLDKDYVNLVMKYENRFNERVNFSQIRPFSVQIDSFKDRLRYDSFLESERHKFLQKLGLKSSYPNYEPIENN